LDEHRPLPPNVSGSIATDNNYSRNGPNPH